MFIPSFFGTLEIMNMSLLFLGVPIFLSHRHMALNMNMVHVCVVVGLFPLPEDSSVGHISTGFSKSIK